MQILERYYSRSLYCFRLWPLGGYWGQSQCPEGIFLEVWEFLVHIGRLLHSHYAYFLLKDACFCPVLPLLGSVSRLCALPLRWKHPLRYQPRCASLRLAALLAKQNNPRNMTFRKRGTRPEPQTHKRVFETYDLVWREGHGRAHPNLSPPPPPLVLRSISMAHRAFPVLMHLWYF